MLIISGLPEEIELSLKAPKFKVGGKVRITRYKIISSIGYTINWSRKIFVIDSIKKTKSWMYNIIDLN